MKKRYYVLFTALWLVISLLLSAPILLPYLKGSQTIQGSQVVDNSQPIVNEEPRIEGQPVHIQFPAQNISVDVIPGYFNASSQTWTLTRDKAQFAPVTPLPNNKTGNTFIYGHALPQVFSRLVNSNIGDTAIVTTDNGHTFTYKLTAVRDVQPNDISPLQDHKSPIMTVQTCSGTWYQHRRMFTFEFQGVS